MKEKKRMKIDVRIVKSVASVEGRGRSLYAGRETVQKQCVHQQSLFFGEFFSIQWAVCGDDGKASSPEPSKACLADFRKALHSFWSALGTRP